MPAERGFPRQNGKLAMIAEGLHPDGGVMTPERATVALPPGTAGGIGAHAVTHAELEDTGKETV